MAQMTMHMDVSQNSGTPKISMLIGFSIINHPFWSTPIFANTQMANKWMLLSTFCSWDDPPSLGVLNLGDVTIQYIQCWNPRGICIFTYMDSHKCMVHV